MFRILAFAAACVLSSCALTARQPETCAVADGCLQLERGDDGSAIAAARVNDQGPFYFVLDTAASGTSLNEAAVARLGLTPIGADEAVGMGGSIDVRLYRVSAIEAGPLLSRDQVVPEFPAPEFTSHDISGLAGVNLFEGQLVTWDLGAMQVRASASGAPPVGQWREVEVDWMQPWKVLAPITINGVAGEALIDTGAQRTVLNAAFVRALGMDLANAPQVDSITGVDGAAQPLVGVTITTAVVGPWVYRDQRAYAAELPVFQRLGDPDRPLVVLGVDWLAQRRFAIDYQTRRVWLAEP